MKSFVLLAFFVAAAAAIEWTDVRPIEEKFLKSPEKYPLYAALARERSARIVGGQQATPGQFPYSGVLFVDASSGQYFCGCSLLNDQYAVTAAHCVDDVVNGVEAILGAFNIRIEEPEQQYFLIFPNGVTVHEQWNPSQAYNDIALLRFTGRAAFNDRVQPVALPTAEQEDELFVDEVGVTSGWGKTSDGSAQTSDYIRWVENKVIRNVDCRAVYGSNIRNEHVCVDTTGSKGSCDGDSGSPLVIGETLVGIVSFGSSRGCEVGSPNVYSRITRYTKWIEDNMV